MKSQRRRSRGRRLLENRSPRTWPTSSSTKWLASGRKASSRRSSVDGKGSRLSGRSRAAPSAVTVSSDVSARYERLHSNPQRNLGLSGRAVAVHSSFAVEALLGRESRASLWCEEEQS